MKKMSLPKSKQELFNLIDQYLPASERMEFANANDLSAYHFGLGTRIRNNFIYPSNGEIQNLFISPELLLPDTADNISSRILMEYQKYLQDKYETPLLFEVGCMETNDSANHHIG